MLSLGIHSPLLPNPTPTVKALTNQLRFAEEDKAPLLHPQDDTFSKVHASEKKETPTDIATDRRHHPPVNLRSQYQSIEYKLQHQQKTAEAVIGILDYLKSTKAIDSNTHAVLSRPYQLSAELAPLHKRLGMVIFRDKLTGLNVRTELEHDLQDTFTRAKEHKMPFSAFFLDMDHFKQINDTFGHDVGDVVLRHTGIVLQNALPQGAKAYRYGGEELVIIAPNMKSEACKAFAETLLSTVNLTGRKTDSDILINQTVKNPNNKASRDLSFSIGALAYDGTHSLPEWMTQASDVVTTINIMEHLAKSKGRNQCILATTDKLSEKPKVGHYSSLLQDTTTIHGPKVKLPS